MLKNDLVLRGSVGTVELLIFPSNILSRNLQRTLQLVEVSYYLMLGFNLIHRILILSQGGICSTFFGVYSELAKKIPLTSHLMYPQVD